MEYHPDRTIFSDRPGGGFSADGYFISASYIHVFIFCALCLFTPVPICIADSAAIADEIPTHIEMVAPRSENSLLRKAAESIYREAFHRLHIQVTFSGCVPAACGKYVTNGDVDGEVARALVYNRVYPELVRTTESVISLKVGAFSTDPAIKLNSWKDLAGKDYRVAYIPSYFYVDKHVREYVKDENIITVQHWLEGISKVIDKEADIYIGVEITVNEALKGKSTTIRYAGKLDKQPLFPYFNKKHKVLAEKLGVVLSEMKADGTMDRIQAQFH